MKYKVINIDSWRLNDKEAPELMNDDIISLDDDDAARGMAFGALERLDDFFEEIKEEVIEEEVVENVEEVKEETPEFICEVCKKVCKSKAGLKAHLRSHVKM